MLELTKQSKIQLYVGIVLRMNLILPVVSQADVPTTMLTIEQTTTEITEKEGTFCEINNSGDHAYYPHPSDCHKYIRCVGNSSYILECSNGLCFDAVSIICTYCNEVNCSPDSTTTISIKTIDGKITEKEDVTTAMSTTVKTTTDSKILEKEDLPNVTVAQPSYIVVPGQSVTLVCTVTSNLIITNVYWQKNVGGTITIFQSISNINKYSGSTITTPSLTIFDAAQSDAGSYTCFASNSAGVGQSLTTSLSVTGGYQPQNDNSSTITTAVISVLATALAVLVIVIIICCLKRTNARKSERPETYEIQTSQRDHHYYDSTDVYDRIQGPEAIQNEVSFISIPDNRGSSPDYRESEEEHRYLELI